MKEGEKEGAK